MSTQAQALLTAAHRREVGIVATAVRRRIAALAAAAGLDIDAWFDAEAERLIRTVASGHDAAAWLAGRYVRRTAAAEGVRVDPVLARAVREQIATSLRVTGPVAYKSHIAAGGSTDDALRAMTSRLTGAAERLTLDGSRGTVIGTFAESPVIVGWRRITSGRACAFCVMLASRGAVYAKRAVNFRAHDHCRCTAAPLYRHMPEPESVLALRAQWDEVTAGLSGREALAAFRRARRG